MERVVTGRALFSDAKKVLAALLGLLSALSVNAQAVNGKPDVHMTFVPLLEGANAIIAEPVRPDAVRSRIAILIAHPERINTFNYFLGPEFARRGYRTMMLNYYGRETTYEEFLAPIAAAMRYLKGLPGVEKVVLAGHSSGGAELTFYQDVAENGPAACQGPERVYPCKHIESGPLPRADALMLLEANIGAPLRTISLDPAIENADPRKRNQAVDMFDPLNGFDATTRSAIYSSDFEQKYFAAQRMRNASLLEEASARLGKIERGEGTFKDDEPFTVAGGSVRINGARLDLADRRLLAKTHGAHMFLKSDGSSAVQIVRSSLTPTASFADLDRLYDTAQMGTIRHYLSFYGLKTTPEFAITEDDIRGIVWRSSANSAVGNVEGISVPTLLMAGTCAAHLVTIEIAYDHAAAKDKEYVAVEGADHFFAPCKPQYGDTRKRALDYADAWLSRPNRF